MLGYSLAELIEQLPNKRYVKNLQAEDTWVEVPSCVASMASLRIAEMAGSKLCEDEEATACLLDNRGLELLLENLSNPMNDVRESAAVALDSLVASRIPQRCSILSTESALEVLLKRLTDQKEGMRFTVACILHSVYSQPLEKGETASNLVVSFKQGELLRTLLKIVRQFGSLWLLNLHLQHLLDLIYDRVSGEVSRSRVKAVTDAGMLEILEELEVQLRAKEPADQNFTQYVLESVSQLREVVTLA
jgi:HEAT repeat protein